MIISIILVAFNVYVICGAKSLKSDPNKWTALKQSTIAAELMRHPNKKVEDIERKIENIYSFFIALLIVLTITIIVITIMGKINK